MYTCFSLFQFSLDPAQVHDQDCGSVVHMGRSYPDWSCARLYAGFDLLDRQTHSSDALLSVLVNDVHAFFLDFSKAHPATPSPPTQ